MRGALFCRAVGAGHARPATSPLYRFNLQFVGEEFILLCTCWCSLLHGLFCRVGVLDDPAAFRRRKPPRRPVGRPPYNPLSRLCVGRGALTRRRFMWPFVFLFHTGLNTSSSPFFPQPKSAAAYPRSSTRGRAGSARWHRRSGSRHFTRPCAEKSASGRPRPWAASRAASALPRDTAHTDHHTPPGVPSPAAARPRHGSWRTARSAQRSANRRKCRSCV